MSDLLEVLMVTVAMAVPNAQAEDVNVFTRFSAQQAATAFVCADDLGVSTYPAVLEEFEANLIMLEVPREVARIAMEELDNVVSSSLANYHLFPTMVEVFDAPRREGACRLFLDESGIDVDAQLSALQDQSG